jgi:hypothetical protein
LVLESLIGEKNIRQKPYLILPITILISVVAIYFAYVIFPTHASVLSVAFITIALVPIIHNILSSEEDDEERERKSFTTFFARHFNLIMIYVWVFIGVILAFALAYSLFHFPEKQGMFDEQIKSFCAISGACNNGTPFSINGKASAMAFESCQSEATRNIFACTEYIFLNNSQVLFFVIVLSILYGAGALFLIIWNASILGVFFGEMIVLGAFAKGFGLLQSLLFGHGPSELFGYIFGALAGAILSATVSRGDLFTGHHKIILPDILFLSGLAFFSILYGSLTEAVGIVGLADLHFILGIVYIFAIVIAVVIYGNKRTSPMLHWGR